MKKIGCSAEMPMLTCKAVTFYSEGDELAFFKWIESINCIKKFEGIGGHNVSDCQIQKTFRCMFA
jgi:hypothetical protein